MGVRKKCFVASVDGAGMLNTLHFFFLQKTVGEAPTV